MEKIRVTFTEAELEDLEVLLENYDCLSDWEVRTVESLLRKIRKSRNYHFANRRKAIYLDLWRASGGKRDEYERLKDRLLRK